MLSWRGAYTQGSFYEYICSDCSLPECDAINLVDGQKTAVFNFRRDPTQQYALKVGYYLPDRTASQPEDHGHNIHRHENLKYNYLFVNIRQIILYLSYNLTLFEILLEHSC
jgi:hypothetical protein